MSILIGDGFKLESSTKPNFERDQFATLAEMKACTICDEGHKSYCLEDGNRYEYHAANEVNATTGKWRVELFAKSTVKVVHGLDYGVVNNAYVADSSVKINAAIEAASAGDTVYIPANVKAANGTVYGYRITKPIIINKAINFICDGTLNCVLTNEFAIKITASEANVTINGTIQQNNATSGGIQIYSDSANINLVRIKFHSFAGSKTGMPSIQIKSTGYGVYDCVIEGKKIVNSNIGVDVVRESGKNTIGEILFRDFMINSCGTAFKFADNAMLDTENISNQEGNVNSMKLWNIHAEGNTKFIYAKKVRSLEVIGCRYVEQMRTHLLTIDGFIYTGVLVGRTPIKESSILFENSINPSLVGEPREGLYINTPIYDLDTENVKASNCFAFNGHLWYEKQNYYQDGVPPTEPNEDSNPVT